MVFNSLHCACLVIRECVIRGPTETYLADNFGIKEETLTINDVKQLYLAAYGLRARSRFLFIPFNKREVRVLLQSAAKVNPGSME
ncbi:Hypothetical protein FKW44_003432 [Caligus rogercresseyi]|uniref:Uncharacterized protein n=1 Tax=Caligus rogercresseyi TaxID=217165 RepID=A0A7T8KLN4_CALRO|nr:Hypothetical protein FKW44_003432 [Caligus rogercresseyi]